MAAMGEGGSRRWEDLGEDCLVSIFQKVWVEDLVVAVPLVCRSWRRASLRPECWRSLNLSVLGFDKNCHFMALVGPYKVPFPDLLRFLVDRSGGSMVHFIFPDHHAWPRDLEHLSDRCSGLKTLGLPLFSWGEDRCILENAHKWKNLEFLYMRDKPDRFIRFVGEISSHCKKLVGLQVCGVFCDEDVATIAAFLPKLKYLCLTGSHVSKDGLMTVLKGCRELEELHVEQCVGLEVDDEVLQHASHVKNFKYDVPVGTDASDDEFGSNSPEVSSELEKLRRYHWCGSNNEIRFHALTYWVSDEDIL